MKYLCKLLLTALLCISSSLRAQIINTVAGDGSSTYAGDHGQATAAGLDPFDVKCDAAGNLYIAERSNQRIRKVTATGIITTYAGGSFGPLGDGGPATAASLSVLNGIALDRRGNLYIADGPNNRIRKVDTFGVITTIAGTGTAGAAGDGGPATAATVDDPYGLAVDTLGNVYIAESYYNKIRKIDTNGIINTIAGSSAIAGFAGDGGPAIAAELSWPTGLAFDKKGNLYVADFENNRIRKITPSGNIYTVAGSGATGTTPGAFTGSFGGDNGPATAAYLNAPCYLSVDDRGNIYFCDDGNSRVRKVDTAGIITTLAGTATPGFSGDGGPATAAQIKDNTGIGVDPNGNVLFTDNFNSRVRKITRAFIPTCVPAMLASQVVIAPNPVADELVITHAPKGAILQVFNAAGRLQYSGMVMGGDQFSVNVSRYLPGMYTVHILSGGNEASKTIIKL